MSAGLICEAVSVDMARIQMPVFICGFVSREIDMKLYYHFITGLGYIYVNSCAWFSGQERKMPRAVCICVLNGMKKAVSRTVRIERKRFMGRPAWRFAQRCFVN